MLLVFLYTQRPPPNICGESTLQAPKLEFLTTSMTLVKIDVQNTDPTSNFLPGKSETLLVESETSVAWEFILFDDLN